MQDQVLFCQMLKNKQCQIRAVVSYEDFLGFRSQTQKSQTAQQTAPQKVLLGSFHFNCETSGYQSST